jgi:hypothetical protein
LLKGVTNHLKSTKAEVGVTEPLGFFDPAGFCKDVDKARGTTWPGLDVRARKDEHGIAWKSLIQSCFWLSSRHAALRFQS